MIDSIKIGQDGQDLFVLMPSEKSSNGKYYSIVKIEDVALESKFVGAVLQAYLETLDYEEVK